MPYVDFFQLPPDIPLKYHDVICQETHDMALGPAAAVGNSTDDSAFLVDGWTGRKLAWLIDVEFRGRSLTAWRKKPKFCPGAPNFEGWVQLDYDTRTIRGDIGISYRGPGHEAYNNPERAALLMSGYVPREQWAQQMHPETGDWAAYRREDRWIETVVRDDDAPVEAPKRLCITPNPYFSRPLPLP